MNGMMPGGPGVGMDMASAAGGGPEGAAAAAGGKEKVAKAKAASSNKFKRVAGGKSWEDETLADWPESELNERGSILISTKCRIGSQLRSRTSIMNHTV